MSNLIKRKDGSYSRRGLWDNIRANRGSGRRPTKEMLRQERKIRAAEKKEDGGPVYNWIPPIYPRVGARYEQGGWLDEYSEDEKKTKSYKVETPSIITQQKDKTNVVLANDTSYILGTVPETQKYWDVRKDPVWGEPYKFLMNWYTHPETKKRLQKHKFTDNPMTKALSQKRFNDAYDWYFYRLEKNRKEADKVFDPAVENVLSKNEYIDFLDNITREQLKDFKNTSAGFAINSDSVVTLTDKHADPKANIETAIHELTHSTNLDDFYTDYFKKNKPKTPKEDYLDENPSEIYPRIQELRYQLNLTPGIEVTPDMLKNYTPKPGAINIRDYYSDEELAKILNEVAYNPSKELIQTAANGGPVKKSGKLSFYEKLLAYEENPDENKWEFVDPSGLTSWDDAAKGYASWKKSGRKLPTVTEGMDMFSAVPILGKAKKLEEGLKYIHRAWRPSLGKIYQGIDYLQDEYNKKEYGGTIEDQRIPTPAQYEFGLKYAANNTPMMTANQMGTRRSTLPDGKIVDSSPEIPAYAHGATVFTKQTTPTWVAGTPTPTTTQREIAFNRSFSPGTAVPYPEVKIPASAYTPASPPVLQGYNPYNGPMRLHAPDTTQIARHGGRVTKKAGIPYAIHPGTSDAGMYVGPTTQRGITFANGGWLDTYATGEEETQAGPTVSAAAQLATKPYFSPAVVQSVLAKANQPVTTTTGRVISTPKTREKERREKIIAEDPSKYTIRDYEIGIKEPGAGNSVLDDPLAMAILTAVTGGVGIAARPAGTIVKSLAKNLASEYGSIASGGVSDFVTQGIKKLPDYFDKNVNILTKKGKQTKYVYNPDPNNPDLYKESLIEVDAIVPTNLGKQLIPLINFIRNPKQTIKDLKEHQVEKAFSTLDVTKPLKAPFLKLYTTDELNKEYYDIVLRNLVPKDKAEIGIKDFKKAHKQALKNIKNLGVNLGDYVASQQSRLVGLEIRNVLADKLNLFTNPIVTDDYNNRLLLNRDYTWKSSNTKFVEAPEELENALKSLNFDITKFTPEELNVLDAYSRGYDRDLNEFYRYNADNKIFSKYGELLNKAILKHKATLPLAVRRGVGSNYHVKLVDETGKEIGTKLRSDLQVGDIFIDDSFMSTSYDLDFGWGSDDLSEAIQIPGGNKQSIIIPNASSYPQFRDEQELILPKGLIRKVTDVVDPKKHNTKFKYITEILNPYKNGGWLDNL